MALPWNGLVTVSDIERDNLGQPYKAPTPEQTEAAIEQAILDMQGNVETFINRELIVREYCETFGHGNRWKYNLALQKFELSLKNWPVVQVISVTANDGDDLTSEFSLDTETYDNYVLLTDSVRVGIKVRYYAGYRRRDQELSDIQAYSDMHAGLTELPPILPSDIRSCVTELVLNRLTVAKNQQFGVGQTVKGIAGNELQYTKPDSYFSSSRLRRLRKHVRLR